MLEGLDVGDWDEIEELEAAEPDDVRSRVLAAIFAILSRLDPRELRVGDSLAILFFIWTLYNPDFTDEDRKNLVEAREFSEDAASNAAKAADALEELRQAEAAREQLIRQIGALPRGEIISRGNVREYPKGSARRISVLGQGSPIAISERQGRWLKIVYRDPLTDALAEGWLWAGSAELLDDGAGAITRR
jgi:hypothetical protein